jgi:O-methyltransferase involved in polyketide biosynthesis
MTSEKLDIQLGQIQETLLLPLTARIVETKHKNGILSDPKSVEIGENLNFNYRQIENKITEIGVAGLATRAVQFDLQIKSFQQQHPKGKILTLGAGLDTYYYRCDNGQNQWYDLDLEDSMHLRKQLLPIPNERVHYITKSLFDVSWIKDIGPIEEGLLILVPGVFPYFEEEEVMNFLKIIAPQLAGANILFDIISNFGKIIINQKFKESGMTDVQLKWAAIDTQEFEKWSPNIKVVYTIPYFSGIKMKSRYNILTNISMRINDFLLIGQIVKLKFV